MGTLKLTIDRAHPRSILYDRMMFGTSTLPAMTNPDSRRTLVLVRVSYTPPTRHGWYTLVCGLLTSDFGEVVPIAGEPMPLTSQYHAPFGLTTPQQSAFAIGKRQARTSLFTRNEMSPGHMAKMAQIFRDASLGARTDILPFHPNASYAKVEESWGSPTNRQDTSMASSQVPGPTSYRLEELTSGIPPSQICLVGDQSYPWNSSDLPHLPQSHSLHAYESDFMTVAGEPLSSGFSSPVKADLPLDQAHRANVTQDHDSDFEMDAESALNLTDSEHADDDDDQYLVLHGIPLPEPMTESELSPSRSDGPRQGLDAWLDDMFEDRGRPRLRRKAKVSSTLTNPASESQERGGCRKRGTPISTKKSTPATVPRPKLKPLQASRPRGDSNKENHRPTAVPSASMDSRPSGTMFEARTTMGEISNGQSSIKPAAKTPKTTNISLEHGKRPSRFTPLKRPHAALLKSPEKPILSTGAVLLTPKPKKQDDETAKGLSPDVDIYRKGSRPNRIRCASYFDMDIFHQETKPAGSEEAKLELADAIQDNKPTLAEAGPSSRLMEPSRFCPTTKDFEFQRL